MKLTFNTLPSMITDSLLARSRKEGRTVREVAMEALERGLDIDAPAFDLLDADDAESSWIESPAFSSALEEFAHLDAEQN